VPGPLTKLVSPDDLLLVVDVQRDFCPGGQLAVPDGDSVVPIINSLATHFENVVLTQDWHPKNHTSFASIHPGKRPYETVCMPYGEQTLWPDHCVQNTPGAALHPDLNIDRAELILRKGLHREIDSYSAFMENDRQTPTGLAGYLHERGFKRLFLAGLAYDYCVRFSAIDAVRAGFSAFVVEDACRAIDLQNSAAETNREFAQFGVQRITSAGFS
jgi:nicotinamidase/pyrazinamidase